MKSAAFSPEWLHSRLAALLPGYPDVSLCVALSGGVDSVTLLAALAVRGGGKRARPALRAVHVHHGLHANADKWSRHCEVLAQKLKVPFEVVRVKVARSRGMSLEAAARDARYAALAGALKPGEALLVAHHQDDQVETVFLQLLRGAGIAGLAAMPEIAPFAAGQLVRPLLTWSRFDLEEWALGQRLTWVEDDTNSDERLDRNFLRRKVLPLVRERWPGAGAAVSRSARHAAEARRLLDALGRADAELAAVGASLSVQRLRALDRDRVRNALRYWITRRGFATPDSRRLDELAGPLLAARTDANPQVRWRGAVVVRHGNLLSIASDESAPAQGDQQGGRQDVRWEVGAPVEISEPRGTLVIERDRHGPVDLDVLPATLNICRRLGGEKLRPRIGGPTRTLKALLQEARVPPKDRDHLPLIYAGDRLIAVADRWLDATVQATPKTLRRGRIRWSVG